MFQSIPNIDVDITSSQTGVNHNDAIQGINIIIIIIIIIIIAIITIIISIIIIIII